MNDWPLVGRAGERRRLEPLLASNSCRGVVLAGPSGSGKTRLAIECLAVAAGSGAVTARATATVSAAAVPFGALAALLAPGDEPEIAALRRSHVPGGRHSAPSAHQHRSYSLNPWAAKGSPT